jgi:hypothetical protein
MKYKVESIGAAFNDKAIAHLAEKLSAQSEQGWEFHSVFSVEKRGCMGSNMGATYLAIYRKED